MTPSAPDPSAPDQVLDQAWERIEEGDPRAGLQLLACLGDDPPERWLAECVARKDLGELAQAEYALGRAVRALEPDDSGLLWVRAELRLAQWRVIEARSDYEELARAERDEGVLDRLALLADMEGNHSGADRLLVEARRLAPERPPPQRLSPAEFEGIVAQAASALPPAFRSVLERVPVVIDPMPSLALARSGPPADGPPDLLGLYVGSPLGEGSAELPEEPALIYLFQRNIERVCSTRAELLDEITVTLYHELGHALGFDEQGVGELGLE